VLLQTACTYKMQLAKLWSTVGLFQYRNVTFTIHRRVVVTL